MDRGKWEVLLWIVIPLHFGRAIIPFEMQLWTLEPQWMVTRRSRRMMKWRRTLSPLFLRWLQSLLMAG